MKGGREVWGGYIGIRFKGMEITGIGAPAIILALGLLTLCMTGLPLYFIEDDGLKIIGAICTSFIGLVLFFGGLLLLRS